MVFMMLLMLMMLVMMVMMFVVFVRVVNALARSNAHEDVLPQPLLGLAHGLAFGTRQILLKAHAEFTITFAKLMRARVSIRLLSFSWD